jgi:autotransporter-associated beta strand protein
LGSGEDSLTINNSNSVLNLNGNSIAVADLSGSGTILNNSFTAVTLTVDETSNSTFSGNIIMIEGSVIELVKAGEGMLTLAGSDSGANALVQAGTLEVTNDNTLPGSVEVAAGATFAALVDGVGNVDSQGISNWAGGTSNVTFDPGSSLGIDVSGTFTYDSTQYNPLSGDIGLVKLGSGTLALNGDNSYSGGTAIKDGTLAVNDDGNLGDPSGALRIYSATLAIATDGSPFTSARTVYIDGNATISDGNPGAPYNFQGDDFTGRIAGRGSLTLEGGGSLEFDGNINLRGDLNVESENVFLDGTARVHGNLTVESGTLITLNNAC